MSFLDQQEKRSDIIEKLVTWFVWVAAPAAFLGGATVALLVQAAADLWGMVLYHKAIGAMAFMAIPNAIVIGLYCLPPTFGAVCLFLSPLFWRFPTVVRRRWFVLPAMMITAALCYCYFLNNPKIFYWRPDDGWRRVGESILCGAPTGFWCWFFYRRLLI